MPIADRETLRPICQAVVGRRCTSSRLGRAACGACRSVTLETAVPNTPRPWHSTTCAESARPGRPNRFCTARPGRAAAVGALSQVSLGHWLGDQPRRGPVQGAWPGRWRRRCRHSGDRTLWCLGLPGRPTRTPTTRPGARSSSVRDLDLAGPRVPSGRRELCWRPSGARAASFRGRFVRGVIRDAGGPSGRKPITRSVPRSGVGPLGPPVACVRRCRTRIAQPRAASHRRRRSGGGGPAGASCSTLPAGSAPG
jgi:hypothetical protein